MKVDFKKYRATVLALLIVLGINVVMPAAVLATSFYCNVESNSTAETVVPSVDCCIENELNSIFGLSNDDIVDNCTVLQACNQLISDPFTKLESLLPAEKQVKTLLSAPAFVNSLYSFDNSGVAVNHISLDTSFPYPAPPIFLVNSTFLN